MTLPQVTPFYRALGQRRRILRFDPPGVGISPPGEQNFGLERQVECIAAILDAAGESRTSVLACGLDVPAGIAFAAAQPDRVDRLILVCGSAAVLASDDHPGGMDPRLSYALALLMEADWRLGSHVVAQLFLDVADPELVTWYAEYQRMAMSAETAARRMRDMARIDVRPVLTQVRAPTLVVHYRDTRVPTLSSARALAYGIPDGQLAIRPGATSVPQIVDPVGLAEEVRTFLEPLDSVLTPRELTVLHKLTEGLSNRAIGRALGISELTAARHVANILRKLDVNSRTAAVGMAYSLGLRAAGDSEPEFDARRSRRKAAPSTVG
jgi:pimeloyl-ACP methyl ester carboxylesterase/DNA-binding CsgD family transcriptional regulator